MAADTGKAMVCVAQIGAPHGVRGAFHLRAFTEDPANVTAYGTLCDEHGAPLFDLRLVGTSKGGLIATAPGITDRNAAEALRGVSLYVPRERLPAPDEDEFYHEDLVGLDAHDAAGRLLGRVTAVMNFGAGDILEIDLGEGRSELVPFTRASVPKVDLAARRVEVVLP